MFADLLSENVRFPQHSESRFNVSGFSGKSLTRDLISQIKSVCDRFERAFLRGQPLTIEAMAAGTETNGTDMPRVDVRVDEW